MSKTVITDKIINVAKALEDAERWATVGMERQACRHLMHARWDLEAAIELLKDRVVEVSA
jgi:hypothetical protein